MKIVSLELENIGPFRKKEFLDFMAEPLCSESIFAVTGRTASGKTTLMIDAICVSLYNKTPRLDSNKNKNRGHLLSQGAYEGFVKFIFEINGIIYIAEWVAKRKKNGSVDSESKIVRKDTNKTVDAIDLLGMDFDTFRRSVLLAQGEFRAFLDADIDKKRKIIETVAGMEIYNILKEKLNEKVKIVTTKYDSINDILKTIPHIIPEMITTENEKLEKLKAELYNLNELKDELEKEKEIEKRRYIIYTELEESKKRYEELISNKDEMDNIQIEIELADRATGILSNKSLHDSEKGRYYDLNIILENTKKEFEVEQNSFNQVKSEYDIDINTLEDARVNAVEKRVVFNDAANYEIKGNGLIQEAENKQIEANGLKHDIGQLKINIDKKNSEIIRLEKESVDDKKFIEDHPFSDNISEYISCASEKAAFIKEDEKILSREKDNLQNKELEYQKCEEQLKFLYGDKSNNEEEKSSCITKLDNNKKSIENIIIEGDKDYWISIKSAWECVRDIGDKFIESYDTFSKLFSDNSQKIFNDAIITYKNKIEQLNLEIIRTEEKLRYCEEDKEFEHAKYQAIVLRNRHLKDGIACLVCGSLEHPWGDKVEVDIEESIKNVDKNVQDAKSNLQATKDRLKTVFGDLFKISKASISKCQNNISKIEIIIREKDNIVNELDIIKQKIKANDDRIGLFIDQKKKLDKELIDIIGRINDIESNISKNKKEFFDIVPPEFKNDTIESALNKFNGLILYINGCKKRQGERYQKIIEYSSYVNENNRRIEDDIVRYNDILKIIKKYEDEGNEYLRISIENTNGLGADAARTELEKLLSEFEIKEKNSREKYQKSDNRLITIKQKLYDLETETKITLQKYEKAKSGYVQALENSGFKSIEEHNLSFREQSWLEENKNIILKYQQDIHTVKETITSQEKNFSERPYNVNDLEEIINREESLKLTIIEKIKGQGEISQKIKNFEENMNKRCIQQKLLDNAEKERRRWENLQNIMPKNDLRDFALETMFDVLMSFTNDQLSKIEPRYYLKFRGMNDIIITDNWNAGESRPIETLSGGESFIVSLSLALALSEISIGRSRIQSLFLDEGFGTLDSETLEKVLYALERLRLSGKTICVISHIDQLTRRIPVKIEVKTLNGVSRVKVKG